MAHVHQCGQCMTMERRPRHREISAQVWSLLNQWGEVEEGAMARPLCESCYHDIREILIDRSPEMERAFAAGFVGTSAPKTTRKAASAAETPAHSSARAPTAPTRGRKSQKVGRIAS